MPPETLDFPDYLLDGMRQLAEALEGRRINYALIGGLAAGYRSRPRFTEDLDLLLQVPQLALPSLLDDLRDRGFTFETDVAVREWTREHMTVLSFHGVRVDWLKPVLPAYQHVLDRARPEDWLGRPVRIAAAEGLILMKLLAFRTQDQVDVENLLAANQGQLDIEQIRHEWQTVAAQDDPRMRWFEDRITRFYLPYPEGGTPEPA
jgi:hypothetical protein